MIDYYDILATAIGSFLAILVGYRIQNKIHERQTKFRLARMILVELRAKPLRILEMSMEGKLVDETENGVYAGMVNSGSIGHFDGDIQIDLHDFYRLNIRDHKTQYEKNYIVLIEKFRKILLSNSPIEEIVRRNSKTIAGLMLFIASIVVSTAIIVVYIFLIIASHLSKINIIDIVDWIIKLGMA